MSYTPEDQLQALSDDEFRRTVMREYREEFEAEHRAQSLIKVGERMKWVDERIRKINAKVEVATLREENEIWVDKYKDDFEQLNELLGNLDEQRSKVKDQLEYLYVQSDDDDLYTYDTEDGEMWQDEDQEKKAFEIWAETADLESRLDQITSQIGQYEIQQEELENDWAKDLADSRLKDRQTREELARQLNELRTVYEYTATDIAEKAGIDEKKMRRYLTGEVKLTPKDLDKIAALGPDWGKVTHSLLEQQLYNPNWNDTLNNILKSVANNYEPPNQEKETGACPACGKSDFIKVEKTQSGSGRGLQREDVVNERYRRCDKKAGGCGNGWWTVEITYDRASRVYENSYKFKQLSDEAEKLKGQIFNNDNTAMASHLLEEFLKPNQGGISDLNFARLNPEVAQFWHPDNEKSATEYLPMSTDKVRWKCSLGHEYEAVIANQVNGQGCPECGKQKRESLKLYAMSIETLAMNVDIDNGIVEEFNKWKDGADKLEGSVRIKEADEWHTRLVLLETSVKTEIDRLENERLNVDSSDDPNLLHKADGQINDIIGFANQLNKEREVARTISKGKKIVPIPEVQEDKKVAMKAPKNESDTESELVKLKKLFDQGLISEKIWEQKTAELL